MYNINKINNIAKKETYFNKIVKKHFVYNSSIRYYYFCNRF